MWGSFQKNEIRYVRGDLLHCLLVLLLVCRLVRHQETEGSVSKQKGLNKPLKLNSWVSDSFSSVTKTQNVSQNLCSCRLYWYYKVR